MGTCGQQSNFYLVVQNNFEHRLRLDLREMWLAVMALSLMAQCSDVRLVKWPAHSLYFTGT